MVRPRNFYRFKEEGLLLLRVGIGFMFILHGWPKITGGMEMWEKVGSAMSVFGITSGAAFFGFMAAFAETVGGLFLMLGFLFRPMTLLLFATMLVATFRHMAAGDGFGGYSHALESAILFLGLFFIGPGKYSLDDKMLGDSSKNRLY
ncbi:DoxX family protein [Rufibacter latericius]|uniref:DoxX family protein n=1 Tax=Rufibacter latericius TaxID=2487040 RepID=A0A3M9N0D0_9BACT|nr:DoxX family protein [Rufibacter latericius]RNI31244.1 DoxX family protein [Rufibacter latericius]